MTDEQAERLIAVCERIAVALEENNSVGNPALERWVEMNAKPDPSIAERPLGFSSGKRTDSTADALAERAK
jgi:hypothetical protein